MADEKATLGPFQRWFKRGFGPRLVGVIPHDAKLAPGTDVDDKNRGKVPGNLRHDGWVGLGGKFIDRPATTTDEARQWQKDGAQVGMFAQFFPAVDIDVNDEQAAREIQQIAFETLGDAPVRYRKGSARRLLPYRCKAGSIRKGRIAFKLNREADEVHAVELLGAGQYYNVDGIHPSGEAYRWTDDTFMASKLVEIDEAKVKKFFAAVADHLDTFYMIVKQTQSGSSSRERKAVGDKSLQAQKPEMVLEVLKAVPCNDETFETRDDFVQVLAAIKGALGDAHDDYWSAVLDWSLEYPGAEDHYITSIWESFRKVAVGWSFLEAWARGKGYTGSAQRAFDDGVAERIIEELPDDHP